MRRLPEISPRIEIGAVSFGSDWPGVFIRGDEALSLAGRLRRFDRLPEHIRRMFLAEIIELLESCDASQEACALSASNDAESRPDHGHLGDA